MNLYVCIYLRTDNINTTLRSCLVLLLSISRLTLKKGFSCMLMLERSIAIAISGVHDIAIAIANSQDFSIL